MNIKEIYNSKLISVEEALSKIKSNDNIVTGMAGAEGKEILEKHTKVAIYLIFQTIYT